MKNNNAPQSLTEATAEPCKDVTQFDSDMEHRREINRNIINALRQADADRFQHLEDIVERGKQTFIEVGTALMEIRDSRFYRISGFKTFGGYCQSRGFSRNFAHMQIQSAGIAGELLTTVNIPNEKTAREFISVPAEDRPVVAEQAKVIAAEQGRDTINSRDVKEAKAKRKAGPVYHCAECRNTFTESDGDCPRCHPPEPETVEFVPADDPEFDEAGFQTLCSSFRQSIFDARIGWPRKHLIRLEVEVSNMFHCGIPAAAPLVAGGEV
jgi:hypothetical protein